MWGTTPEDGVVVWVGVGVSWSTLWGRGASCASPTLGRQGSGGAGGDITLCWRPQVKLPVKAVGSGEDLLLEVVPLASLRLLEELG